VWNVLIPVLGAVLVAVVAAAGQVINSRNDRAQAHQEVDLLQKLRQMDPTSDTAKQLDEVVQVRIGRWHRKFYKDTPKLMGRRRLPPAILVPIVVWLLIIFVIFLISYFVPSP
jgi:hypothetical protein